MLRSTASVADAPAQQNMFVTPVTGPPAHARRVKRTSAASQGHSLGTQGQSPRSPEGPASLEAGDSLWGKLSGSTGSPRSRVGGCCGITYRCLRSARIVRVGAQTVVEPVGKQAGPEGCDAECDGVQGDRGDVRPHAEAEEEKNKKQEEKVEERPKTEQPEEGLREQLGLFQNDPLPMERVVADRELATVPEEPNAHMAEQCLVEQEEIRFQRPPPAQCDCERGFANSPEKLARLAASSAVDPKSLGISRQQLVDFFLDAKSDLHGYCDSHLLSQDTKGHVCKRAECPYQHVNAEKVAPQPGDSQMSPDMHMVVLRYIRPATVEGGSWATVKNVDNGRAIEATKFVSHSWTDRFSEFVEILSVNTSPDDGLWICAFAMDQNLIAASNYLCHHKLPFAVALCSLPSFALVIGSRMDVFDRAWCIYETYSACSKDKLVSVLSRDMVDPSVWADIEQRANAIDVFKTQATKAQDKESILHAVGGCEQQVKQQICIKMQELAKSSISDRRQENVNLMKEMFEGSAALKLQAIATFASKPYLLMELEKPSSSLKSVFDDTDRDVRLALAKAFAQVPVHAVWPHIELIAAKISDDDEEVRSFIRSALLRLGHEQYAKALTAAFAGSDTRAPHAAIEAFVELPASIAKQLLPMLTGAFRHEDNTVREAALRAFVGLPHEDAIGHVQALADLLRHENAATRLLAAEAFHKRGDIARPCMAELQVRLIDPDPQVRAALADVLAGLGDVGAHSAADLCHEDPQVRCSAGYQLFSLGKNANAHHAALAARLDDAEPRIRALAASLLGCLGAATATQYAEALGARLGDSDVGVRQSAAAALVQLGSDPGSEAVESWSSSSVIKLRVQAIELLEAVLHLWPSYTSQLAAHLNDPSARIRRAATKVLGTLTLSTCPYTAAIAERLQDEDGRVRQTAVSVFLAQSEAAAPYATALAGCLSDERSEVREAAAKVLQAIGGESAALHASDLGCRLADRSSHVRGAAAQALVSIGGSEAAAAAASQLSSADWKTRRLAAKVLGLLGSAAEPHAAELANLLVDSDRHVREVVAKVFGNLSSAVASKHTAQLASCLDDTCAGVRRAAAESLQSIGGPDAICNAFRIEMALSQQPTSPPAPVAPRNPTTPLNLDGRTELSPQHSGGLGFEGTLPSSGKLNARVPLPLDTASLSAADVLSPWQPPFVGPARRLL